MEILSLVKANIKKKKSTCISVLLLTAIVVSLLTAMFSVRKNYETSLVQAYEEAECGEISIYMETEKLTDALRESVEQSALVENVEYAKALRTYGAKVGERADGSNYFFMELPEYVKLFSSSFDELEEEIPPLSEGEIYLPYGLKSRLSCQVGDLITVEFLHGQEASFLIKGFVQEAVQGAFNIGWKKVFISKADYDRLYEACKPLEAETGARVDYTSVYVEQAENNELSVMKFQRELNLETGLISAAMGTLNKEQTLNYTTLMTSMIMNIVSVFLVLLYVIVLIVMSHSISTEIEMEYVTLGVLKSQGFTEGKLRLVLMLQYLLSQFAGVFAGVLIAIPMERWISRLCQSITAILPERGLSVGMSLLLTFGLLLLSVLLVLWKTAKVAKISPVRAISGGQAEIYFDSRFNLPVSKRVLSASLSLRQLTSAGKRYIGTLFIVGILTFSMVTIHLIGNLMSSTKALEAMGMITPDVAVGNEEHDILEDWDGWNEVREIIAGHSEIVQENALFNCYASLNGENLYLEAYENPEGIPGMKKGRVPLYENELVITELVADMLEISMGDEVEVVYGETKKTFLVSGIYQSGSDSGACFGMSFAGVKDLHPSSGWGQRYYLLESREQAEEIEQALTERFGDTLAKRVYAEDENPVEEQFGAIVTALKAIIYGFSLLFAFVVVRMVCTRSFLQERTDIGVFKAIGFSSGKLRTGFALRFAFVALLGSGIGILCSILFSEKLLGLLLGAIGLTNVVFDFSVAAVAVPIAVVTGSFFVFAYFAAKKVKKVEVRELVTE
ncbi:MAG: hypothetical protein IKB07_00395 [Lachnospiraceae bacterium]|nr:hypothetical protein [Lachnospiraceae bacterium]